MTDAKTNTPRQSKAATLAVLNNLGWLISRMTVESFDAGDARHVAATLECLAADLRTAHNLPTGD